MKVSEYLKRHDIEPVDLAARLSEQLDRTLAPGAILARMDKEMPKAWKEALGVVEEEPKEPVEKPKRAAPSAPKPTAEFNPMLAEERIAAIYSMVGRGLSAATQEPRYRQAFDSHADKCGRAWVELAKHDKHVATVVTALTAGGPWGEVLWLNGSLALSIVIISGKVEIGNIGLAPGVAGNKTATAPNNGSGTAGSQNPVGDAGETPS